MARTVTLRSRIPQIMAQMKPEVSDAIHEVAEGIAQAASERAPRGTTGELADSYEAVRGEMPGTSEVRAAWYWHFVDLGTVNAGPRPHLTPAAEEGRQELDKKVGEALRRL